MATAISLKNLSSGNLSVDIKLDEDRAIRESLALGETKALSGVQLDELDANTEMQALISAGKAELVLTDGPIEMLRASFAAAGPTDVTLKASTAHKYQILDSTLIVSTAVGASTVTARDALAGGGNALSSAMSAAATGRVADASTATTELAAGSLIVANKSDAGIAGELLVLVQRLS